MWTLLKNDESYENVLGYSGTNSKYVRIIESAFFNNGAGIVPNTLDSEGYEPNGWNVIERNDVFWNNYNYFLAGSAFHTVSAGLGELSGQTVNYPTGVGIVLYGSDHNVVRGNKVFGNYKWGISSFSGPGETFIANEGNEAKNVNNEIVENVMGREGADPNGEYDIWNDDTGGGNCWGANSANSTFAPGNGKVPLSQIYPVCPQPEIPYAAAKSINLAPRLQIASLAETGNPTLGTNGSPRTRRSRSSSRWKSRRSRVKSRAEAEAQADARGGARRQAGRGGDGGGTCPLGGGRHRRRSTGEEAEVEAEGSVGGRLLLRAGKAHPEGGAVGELGVGGNQHLSARRAPEERAEGVEAEEDLLDQDDRRHQRRIRKAVHDAGHLQVHLHDPPDADAHDDRRQEVGAR